MARFKPPERWYRDVWLVAITGIVVFALATQSAQNDDTQRLADDIQTQRAAAIFVACREQNARHDRTIDTLDRIIAQQPEGPRKERSERNRAYTVLLIDALAPVRNCRGLVRRSVPPE